MAALRFLKNKKVIAINMFLKENEMNIHAKKRKPIALMSLCTLLAIRLGDYS